VPITDADLKGVVSPKAVTGAAGDPDGSLTGTVFDIAKQARQILAPVIWGVSNFSKIFLLASSGPNGINLSHAP
jgi:hypothetical protein